MKSNKPIIISIEPSEGKYLNAIFKLSCSENNINVEEVNNNYDVISGAWIGGIINFLDNKTQASEWVFSLEDFEANDWIIEEK